MLAGFSCQRSYVITDFDVSNPAAARVQVRAAAVGGITSSSAAKA